MKKKIMILEDSLIVSKLMASMLASQGYEISEFDSVGDIINLKEKIDLAILDYQLPDGNGLEAAENLKKRFPGLPMILLTARGSAVSQADAEAAGIKTFLEKPVDSQDLLNTIKLFLD